jgi:hypothetical protein
LLVFEVVGLTVAVQPDLQIVSLMLAWVTPLLMVPGGAVWVGQRLPAALTKVAGPRRRHRSVRVTDREWSGG